MLPMGFRADLFNFTHPDRSKTCRLVAPGMRRPPLAILVIVGFVCLWPKGILLRGEEPLIQVDDSFVTADDDGRGWTIGNQLIHYSFGADGQTFGIRSIQDVVDGREWQRSSAPDTFVNINGLRVQIGSAATPFARASVTEWWGGVRLDVTYRH